jgi:hypothetical protein
MGTLWRLLAIAALLLFAGLVAILTYNNAQGVPAEELSRRCAESRPEWSSYQEDVKGQVGAAPVAAWKGEPVRVELAGGRLLITFRLPPPWSGYDAALPVLVRDPLGSVSRNISAERRDDGLRVYGFTLPGAQDAAPIPWIEIRYPHTERRIPLDARGVWQAGQ